MKTLLKIVLRVLRFAVYVGIGYAIHYFGLDEIIYKFISGLF